MKNAKGQDQEAIIPGSSRHEEALEILGLPTDGSWLHLGIIFHRDFFKGREHTRLFPEGIPIPLIVQQPAFQDWASIMCLTRAIMTSSTPTGELEKLRLLELRQAVELMVHGWNPGRCCNGGNWDGSEDCETFCHGDSIIDAALRRTYPGALICRNCIKHYARQLQEDVNRVPFGRVVITFGERVANTFP